MSQFKIIPRPKPKMSHGIDGILKLMELMRAEDLNTILDVGCGKLQEHTKNFELNGFTVDTVDFFDDCTYIGDYNHLNINKQYDAVNAAHVLEHQPNVNIFLKNLNSNLKEGGFLNITVPPLKHEIVGGHLTLWNAGLIIYNLILAGFNCHTNVRIKEYKYNISIIVKKETIKQLPPLVYDGPDLDTLRPYLPKNFQYKNWSVFNGDIKQYNWN